MKKYLMVAAILAVGTTTLAEKEARLEETVITTNESFGTTTQETAKNVYVVTAEEIKEKGATTVTDAVKGVPGVIVQKLDGSNAVIDLRGQGAAGASRGQNTMILLDGIPLNGLVKININSIPIGEIEKIEIIQGGGAVMYGDGAIGGVVNIITKAPENKLNYGSVGLEAGSWETTRENLSYGTKIGKNLLVNASYSGYSSMEWRDRDPKYKDDEDVNESIWLRGKYLLKDGNIELRYNHNKLKDYFTGGLLGKEYEENPQQIGTWAGLSHTITDIWSLSYNKKLADKLDFLIYGGYSEEESKDQNTLTKEYFIKPQLKYSYGDNSYIIIGGDYRDGNKEFKEAVPVNGKVQKAPDDERESYAGYIMNKTTFGKWQFTQGYRREKVEYKYSQKKYDDSWKLVEISPMAADYSDNNSYELGVNYLYSDTGNIYFNYTRATRTPTIADAGAWFGSVETQKNDIYEIGVRDYYKNTAIATSVFYIESENEIYYDKFHKYGNTNFDGEVRRIGAQLALAHYFDKLTLRENISYIKPEVTSGIYDGKTFAGVPEWTLNLGATYRFNEKLYVNTDIYYQADAYAEDDFDNYFGKENDYVTVDTNISYTLDNGLELYGGIRNLFDEEYSYTTILSSDRKNMSYQPADGRSYYAGFRYSF